jgi:hypothetical protein
MKSLTATYNILTSNSALNTAVSGRISPLRLPQAITFPAISYFQVSLIPNNTQSGYSKSDFARVQVNIFGLTLASCLEIADKTRTAMQISSGTFNGVYVHQVKFDNEVLLSDDSAGEEGVYHVAQDYIIHLNTSTTITDYKILLENAEFLLLENGDKILG